MEIIQRKNKISIDQQFSNAPKMIS